MIKSHRTPFYLIMGIMVVVMPLIALESNIAASQSNVETIVRRCADSRGTVEATGLRLPADFEYRCTSNEYPHWGVTSGPPNAPPHFVSINVGRIGGDDGKLRYVIAHELCHARSSVGQEPGPWTDEQKADDCAKRYGFPNKYFARTDEGQRTPLLFVGVGVALLMAAVAIVIALRRKKKSSR